MHKTQKKQQGKKSQIARSRATHWDVSCSLLYLSVSTRAVIGQFSGPFSPVRPAKI